MIQENIVLLRFTLHILLRSGSRAATTSKMERFVIIVNGFQPLTIITKRSILDVAAALDPPLLLLLFHFTFLFWWAHGWEWTLWQTVNIIATKHFATIREARYQTNGRTNGSSCGMQVILNERFLLRIGET